MEKDIKPTPEQLLKEALALIWEMDHGYYKQPEAKKFMEKCNYDFYDRENWSL